MKRSYTAIITAILLAVALGALSGCNNQPANQANASANTQDVNGNVPTNDSKAAKDYPEMPEKIMNAEIKGLEGDTFTLASLKGKVVLVNLWAIWCTPCKIEMPELMKVEDEFRDKGLMVVGLDIESEDTPEDVKKLLSQLKVSYKTGWADDEVNREFIKISKMDGIPQTFLLTREGKLAAIFKGYNPNKTPSDVRAKIEEVLGKDS